MLFALPFLVWSFSGNYITRLTREVDLQQWVTRIMVVHLTMLANFKYSIIGDNSQEKKGKYHFLQTCQSYYDLSLKGLRGTGLLKIVTMEHCMLTYTHNAAMVLELPFKVMTCSSIRAHIQVNHYAWTPCEYKHSIQKCECILKRHIIICPWRRVLTALCVHFELCTFCLRTMDNDDNVWLVSPFPNLHCFQRAWTSRYDWPQLWTQPLHNPYSHTYYVWKSIRPNPTRLLWAPRSAPCSKPRKCLNCVTTPTAHTAFFTTACFPWHKIQKSKPLK